MKAESPEYRAFPVRWPHEGWGEPYVLIDKNEARRLGEELLAWAHEKPKEKGGE